ncbi:MAG: ABC transporter substrate-binding protein [Candidatus Merdivicinus sp.]|jgi:putative aldouronate transport system substrate-binding protein
MVKRILAVLFAALLTASLTACGGNDTSGKTSEPSASNGAESGAEESGAANADLREPELVTLDIITMASGKEESGVAQVEEAMNKILEEKLNVNVNLTFFPFGSYAEQTTLMLSAGEGVDLMAVYMVPYASCATSGQLYPMDDLIEEYGQGIIEQLGWDMIDCGRVDGELFGLTQGRDLAASQGFVYRLDLAEKYNLDMSSVKTLEDLHEVLTVIKENEENVWPVAVSAGENIRNWGWDALGDEMINLGVLADGAQNTTVVNLYETEQYKNLATTMYTWMQEGLIQPDAVNTTETASTLMEAGTAFGNFTNLKPYYAEENNPNFTNKIGTVELVDALSTTDRVTMGLWSIAGSTKHPEAAMKMLNELYSNPEISNLYMYGVEGIHYQVLEEGAVSNGQDVIGYLDGVDATTTTYRKSGTWLMPNQFIGDIWGADLPHDYWDATRDFNNNSQKSAAFGFSFDATKTANEITACTNVVNKYHKALLCGALNPEETLPKFNQELKDAGLDVIIQEKQAQLDAWLAAQS